MARKQQLYYSAIYLNGHRWFTTIFCAPTKKAAASFAYQTLDASDLDNEGTTEKSMVNYTSLIFCCPDKKRAYIKPNAWT